MHLFKRSNGIYYLKYLDSEGRLKKISTGKRKKKEALKFLNQFSNQPQKTTPVYLNLKQASDKFLSIKKETVSDNHYKSLKETIDKFEISIGGKTSIKNISKDEIQNFLLFIFNNQSKHTAQRYFNNLKSFFNWLSANELSEKNPITKATLPKIPEKKPLWIDENQLEQVLALEMEQLFKDIYFVLFNTGMRAGELLSLHWRNVDLAEKLIYIRNSDDFTTKTKRERAIPINEKTFKVIQRQPTRFKGGLLFKRNGKQLTVDYVSKRFKKVLRQTDIDQDIRLHSLRHSYASNLIRKGVPIYYVKELLGHTQLRTTEKYSHTKVNDLKNLIDNL